MFDLGMAGTEKIIGATCRSTYTLCPGYSPCNYVEVLKIGCGAATMEGGQLCVVVVDDIASGREA